MDAFEYRCSLFGPYVAYWLSPLGALDGNFLTMFDFLTFLGLPWNNDLSWILFKRYKFVGRSATYLGI